MDVQLLMAAAAMVVLIVVVLACCLSVGARERPFERPRWLAADTCPPPAKLKHKAAHKPANKPKPPEPAASLVHADTPVEADEEGVRRRATCRATDAEAPLVEAKAPDEHPRDPGAESNRSASTTRVKQKKKPSPVVESSEAGIEETMEQLRKARIAESHLSAVVESLLSAQGEAEKNESELVKKLRRQLDEKERALAAESQLLNTANQRARETKSLLVGEQREFQRVQATFREQLSAKQDDLLRLSAAVDAATLDRVAVAALQQDLGRAKERAARAEQQLAACQAELQRTQTDAADRQRQCLRAEQTCAEANALAERQSAAVDAAARDSADALSRKDVELTKLRGDYAALKQAAADLSDDLRRSQLAASVAAPQLNSDELQSARDDLAEVRSRLTKLQAELQKKADVTAELRASLDAANEKAAADADEAAERLRLVEKEKNAVDEQLFKEKEERVRAAKAADCELTELRARLLTAQATERQLAALQKDHEALRVAERSLVDRVQEEASRRAAAEADAVEARAQLAAAKQPRMDAGDADALRATLPNGLLDEDESEVAVTLSVTADDAVAAVGAPRLAGSFWQWADTRALYWDAPTGRWTAPTLRLPRRCRHTFKFVNGAGVWLCADAYPTVVDADGVANNFVDT